jgi:hypothetical protein
MWSSTAFTENSTSRGGKCGCSNDNRSMSSDLVMVFIVFYRAAVA